MSIVVVNLNKAWLFQHDEVTNVALPQYWTTGFNDRFLWSSGPQRRLELLWGYQ